MRSDNTESCLFFQGQESCLLLANVNIHFAGVCVLALLKITLWTSSYSNNLLKSMIYLFFKLFILTHSLFKFSEY